MNFKALAIAILAAGSSTLGFAKSAESTGTVTVCLADPTLDITIDQAKMTVSAMFRKADVNVVWRHSAADCRKPGAQGIVIDLLTHAPQDAPQLAMARAYAYEGVHIQIFRNRVSHPEGGLNTPLFAHVIVHEITHILQGVARHSETGIMKATWTRDDFMRMQTTPLAFSADDIEMIHLGMLRRSADGPATALLARNITTPEAAETR